MVPRRLSRSTSSCFLSSSNLEIISPCPPRQALSNFLKRRINPFFLPNSDRKIQMALKFFKNPLTTFRQQKLMNTKEIGLFFIAAFYVFQSFRSEFSSWNRWHRNSFHFHLLLLEFLKNSAFCFFYIKTIYFPNKSSLQTNNFEEEKSPIQKSKGDKSITPLSPRAK